MPRSLRISALDTVLELTFPDSVPPSLMGTAAHAWSRCLIDVAPPPSSDRATAEPLKVTPPADDSDEAIRAALQRLSQDVTHRLIAAQSGRLLMFHAGAVSHPQTGASLVFVAPSGTGKTTLARLLGATHGYLTDETAGIDPLTGMIHPYPKPLSVSSSDRFRKSETSPDDLDLLPAHPKTRVSRIVILNRTRAAEETKVRQEELPLLDAIAALIPESSALNLLPRPLHVVADLLERTGPLVRLTYAEAGYLVPLISEMLEEA